MKTIERAEVLGVMTDFQIESTPGEQENTVTVSCVFPSVRYDPERDVLLVCPPTKQIGDLS